MLDTSTWKPHKIGKIFNVVKGKRLTSENQEIGDNVFIGATEDNNGVTAYIGQEPLFPGNVISVAYNGSVGEAFYQPEPFWASDDVNVLLPKEFELNESIALFICAVLRHEKQMWGYARKWNLKQMTDTTILLPTTDDGLVDTGFMEAYMTTLDGNVEDIPDYFLEEGFNKACWYIDHIDSNIFEREYAAHAQKGNLSLMNRDWKEFKMGDENIFKITRGESGPKSYLKNQLSGDIPYITTTSLNNGISAFVAESNRDGGVLSLAYDGSIGACFFQEEPFFSTEKIVSIDLASATMTKEIAMFLIPIFQKAASSYSYGGRKWAVEAKMKETMIMLPVDNNDNPDWQFMEDYIKQRKFSGNI